MNKTLIPWADYSINPVKGLCPMDCKDLAGKPYCYARRMYKRFKWNPEITYDGQWWQPLRRIKAGNKIFIGSTFELFHDSVSDEWRERIFKWVKIFGDLTFIFLTKQPQNLAKWSPFPPNCWVGVSATDQEKMYWAGYELVKVQAKVKFVSFEPLLDWKTPLKWLTNPLFQYFKYAGINWIILGSRTQPVKHPPREWVDEIISAADNAGIPVFVKSPLAEYMGINRKEFPISTGLRG